MQEYEFHIAKEHITSDSFEQMLNSTFSAKPLFTWCIHKSYAFKMEPLYWAVRIITSSHITRLWTITKTRPELIPSSGYLITGLLFSCRSSFTSTSLSSLLYIINRLQYSERFAFVLLHLLSSSLGYPFELSQSFSLVPVFFQLQSNLPDSPRWRHIKKQNTSYPPPRGTDL